MKFCSFQHGCTVLLSYFLSIWVAGLKSECIGVPSVRAQTMECTANNFATDCDLRFPGGTSLGYKCRQNYIPTGEKSDNYRDHWKYVFCQQDNTWSGGYGFLSLTCIIDYGKFRNSFGVPLLSNAKPVNPMEYPWHAALYFRGKQEYHCGGTLIAPDFILTAAHCTFRGAGTTDDPLQPFELEAVLAPISGIYGLNNLPQCQKRVVSQIILPNTRGTPYVGKSNNYKNDLALLRLSYPAQLNTRYVQVVRLPFRDDIVPNMVLQVNGYGTTSPDPRQLRPASTFYGATVIVNPPQCVGDPDSMNDPQRQFCAAPTNPVTQICAGDSGGGSFKREANDHWSVQGVVSYGFPRNMDPDKGLCFTNVIFTRIYFFLPWINANIVPQSQNTAPPPPQPRMIILAPAPTPIQPSPSPVQSGLISTNSVNQVAFSLHNDYRRRHGSPPMQIDYGLVSQAQQYADYIVSNNLGVQPKYGSPYGQNTYVDIGVSSPSDESARKAVAYWYNGIFSYYWAAPLSSNYRGLSFSQVVWKSSLRLGIGVASQKDRSVVIAFYSPAGNVADLQSYRDNVLPPR